MKPGFWNRFGSRLDSVGRFGSRALHKAAHFGSRISTGGLQALAAVTPAAELLTEGAATPFIAAGAAALGGLGAASRAAEGAATVIDSARDGARALHRGSLSGAVRATAKGAGGLMDAAQNVSQARATGAQYQGARAQMKSRRSHLEAS